MLESDALILLDTFIDPRQERAGRGRTIASDHNKAAFPIDILISGQFDRENRLFISTILTQPAMS